MQCVSFEAHFIYFKEEKEMQRKFVKNLMLVLTLVVLCLAVGLSASAEERTIIDKVTMLSGLSMMTVNLLSAARVR